MKRNNKLGVTLSTLRSTDNREAYLKTQKTAEEGGEKRDKLRAKVKTKAPAVALFIKAQEKVQEGVKDSEKPIRKGRVASKKLGGDDDAVKHVGEGDWWGVWVWQSVGGPWSQCRRYYSFSPLTILLHTR
nr:hypothetical protein Iba_chr12fCG18600 [Ipomoea batatas]